VLKADKAAMEARCALLFEALRLNTNVDMAVFCQLGRPLPTHRHEFLSQHALSVLFVLQIRLVGGTVF
jgi:hypothetical protein